MTRLRAASSKRLLRFDGGKTMSEAAQAEFLGAHCGSESSFLPAAGPYSYGPFLILGCAIGDHSSVVACQGLVLAGQPNRDPERALRKTLMRKMICAAARTNADHVIPRSTGIRLV